MELKQIISKHWMDAEAAPAFARLIRTYLDSHIGAPISSSALFRALGAEFGDYKTLTSHSWAARDAGLLDGYFDKGGKGAFGKPRITWHSKAILAITGNTYRDKILAALDEDARPGMLAYWAEQDAVASKPQSNENEEDWLNQT